MNLPPGWSIPIPARFCLFDMTMQVPDPRIDPHAWARLKPHVRELLIRINRHPRPPMESLPAEQARAAYAAGSGVLEIPAPPLPRIENFTIPARDGHLLPARLYAASTEAQGVLPVLLFFHGGGFLVGSVDTHDTLCRTLAAQSGCAVVSVDYRLGPEHQFPTAFEDAWDSLAWLHEYGAVLGLDPARLAVGGDSAGGTLAAGCAVQARDTGLPLRLQLLFYPGMQAAALTPSRARYAYGFLLTEPQIQWMFNSYVGSEEQFLDWRFAPVHAHDVDGLAPAWIGLAECDPIVDDSMMWADRLRMASVPVELEIYHGTIHEFIKMGRALPEALEAHRDAAAALRAALLPELR